MEAYKCTVTPIRILGHAILAAALPFTLTRWWFTIQPVFWLTGPIQESPGTRREEETSRRYCSLVDAYRHCEPHTAPILRYEGQDFSSEGQKLVSWWSPDFAQVHSFYSVEGVDLDSSGERNQNSLMILSGLEEDFQPGGQQISMDIQNVDPGFLMDKNRILGTMKQVTKEAGLPVLSQHCHDLQDPIGLVCLVVMFKSHISVHTWPRAGIVSIDTFLYGPDSLLSLKPVLEHWFSAPSPKNDSSDKEKPAQPRTRWLSKKRGYRNYSSRDTESTMEDNPEGVELEWFLLGLGLRRKEVAMIKETDFQEAAIFVTTQHPRHHLLGREDLPVAADKPNKQLFLDSVAQSSLNGLEAYHEALVHPALMAHPSPKRVLIIGGGEGATLREVLKHNTVETCTMLEIDGELMDLSREYLKEWNDCTDLVVREGVEEREFLSCFDHPRAQVHSVDAYKWILDRFGVDATIQEEKYDVVIMDALDPSSLVSFSDVLYGGIEFIQAIATALTSSGILVAQVGIADSSSDDGNDHSTPVLERFLHLLRSQKAKSIKRYSESHGQFMAAWDFLVVFMEEDNMDDEGGGSSSGSITRWYSEAGQIDLEVAKRMVPTKSGEFPLYYFDGATQQGYQYPSHIVQDVFCMRRPYDSACHGFSGAGTTIMPGDQQKPNPEANFVIIVPMATHEELLVVSSLKGEFDSQRKSLEASLTVDRYLDLGGGVVVTALVPNTTAASNYQATEKGDWMPEQGEGECIYNPARDRTWMSCRRGRVKSPVIGRCSYVRPFFSVAGFGISQMSKMP